MGPKKKAQDDDDSTQKLLRIYRKKCQQLNINPSKVFRQKVQEALEGDTPHLKKLMFWDQVGPIGTQAIFESLLQQGGYKHLEILILSNLKTSDEGLKYICKYMQTAKTIKQFECQINNISPKGCIYLGQSLSPKYQVPIVKLNLSYNKFGSQGLKYLAKGLAQNNVLQHLTLDNCEIDYEGALYLQQILSFHDSKIYYLSLVGNKLRNQGVYQLFRALQANQALSQLYIGNNQFGQSKQIPVIQKIQQVLRKNSTLVWLNMEGNGLYNESATKFMNIMKQCNPKLLITFGILANKQIMDQFKKLAKKRKLPKKRKRRKEKVKEKRNDDTFSFIFIIITQNLFYFHEFGEMNSRRNVSCLNFYKSLFFILLLL